MLKAVFFILFLSLLYTLDAFESEDFDSSTPAQFDTNSSTPTEFGDDSNLDDEESTTPEAGSLLRRRKPRPKPGPGSGSGSRFNTCEDGQTSCDSRSGQQCRCAQSTCVPKNMEYEENNEGSPGSITLDQFKRAIESSQEVGGTFYRVSNIMGRDFGAIYNNFIRYMYIGGITTRTEAAMFLTNVIQETGGLQFLRELACKDDPAKPNCVNAYDSPNPQCPPIPKNAHYYGRGYIQLSHCYNYREAGDALQRDYYGQPDIVADEVEAWRTAYWFWKAKVKGSAYGKEVAAFKFGSSIRAINCGFECAPGRHDDGTRKADTRIKNYGAVFKAFGASGPFLTEGCPGRPC